MSVDVKELHDGRAIFVETTSGWCFGPVMPSIRFAEIFERFAYARCGAVWWHHERRMSEAYDVFWRRVRAAERAGGER